MNRRQNIYVFLTALMLLAMGCTFAACGSDDDDDSQGNSQVAELKAVLLDENGRVFFDAMGEGAYKIGVLSKEDAIDLIKLYVGSAFTGLPYIYKLDDNKGTVEVTIGDQGVYYTVAFNVEGIPHFRLLLLDEGGNAFGMRHTCKVCGYTWLSTVNRCPRAGNKTYHP
ncbi:MAG: hypothetical protein II949_06830 [Prevotella sp.]|nr:hypothetical protein [Prevotella sp.]